MPTPDLNKGFSWSVQTCNAPDVGYSQSYRNQQTVNGITYYDCSSFIWYACKTMGFDVNAAYLAANGYAYSGNAITTHTEQEWLRHLGYKQQEITGEWKPGDILWKSGHTEMVYQGGQGQGITMGAHSARYALPDQVSINSGVTGQGYWATLWRYGDGDTGTYGYSKYVVAAIAGNWWQESNINPGVWEGLKPGAPGFGLGQWTDNSQTDRKTKLFAYLDEHGYAHDDPYGQLEYFIEENVWYSVGWAKPFDNLQAFLNSPSQDVEMLTKAFMRGWEGIVDGTEDFRVQCAKKCLSFIESNAQDASITEWIISNAYLSEANILRQAVMLFRSLGAGGGGGGQEWPSPGTNWPERKGQRKFWVYMKSPYIQY